jgi:hypothetical protein
MPSHQVQIVIVKPAGYLHGETFRELAETIQCGFAELGISAHIADNVFLSEGLNILLGWHLIEPGQIAGLPHRCILYNLEQLDDQNQNLRLRLAELSKKFRVWDYSLRNIEKLRESGLTAPIAHVPIGYAPQLSRIEKAPVQDIDVLFYGSINERRSAVLRKLEAEGLKVHSVFGVYGAERDALICRSKVVLNLHYYDSSIFEMVRVSYLLANRKAVVAECHTRTEVDEDIRTAAVLVPYENLVPACAELVRHSGRREILERRALAFISRRDEAQILHRVLQEELVVWGVPAPSSVSQPAFRPTPAVSVVVITRNRPVFLRRALQSILGQLFQDFEVLIVNDGGEDVSDLVAEFAREGMTIDLQYHSSPRGQSAARNTALLRAQGRWIAYLDDDDIYYPEHLELLVTTLQKTGAWVVYSDSLRTIEEERDRKWVALSRELAMSHDFDRDLFLRDNLTPINNVMHERACWEICGSHDESLPVLEDWDYWIRLSRKWDFIHIPKVTAEVRWRSSGANITFERQALFPECRRRIAEKVRELLARERMPEQKLGGGASREALLFEPDWMTAEWAEILLSYLQAFAIGEPVALIFLLDPRIQGQLSVEDAQSRILELIARSGRESFPDVVLVDKPAELLETIRNYARAQWIPRGKGCVDGLEGDIGVRFAQVRRCLAL